MDEPHDYFGEEVAATYDDETDVFGPGDVDATVDVLAELAGGGRALELGIGTGRIGLPLAARGVPVQGIELSRAMAARLHAKPGGEQIAVAIGDFATTTVDGTFSLVYLVFNTIMNLTTQEAQVASSATSPRSWNRAAVSSLRSGSPTCACSRPGRASCPGM